jgi:myo-inositol-1-phosphate synthase
MGTIRLGKRTEGRSPLIKDFVPLAGARRHRLRRLGHLRGQLLRGREDAGVLDALLDQIRPELEAIKPMPAVFDRQYVKRLDGPNVKKGKNKKDLAEQLIARHPAFKAENGCDRLVMIWCGSTEIFLTESPAHAVDRGLRAGARGRTTRRSRRA